MGSKGAKTICAACEHQKLVDTTAAPAADTVLIASDGVPFCFAEENRVDPVTGAASGPIPCTRANPTASCAWFSAATPGSKRAGLWRMRGSEGWVPSAASAGLPIPGLLSAKDVASNLALEAARAPSADAPPWDLSWETSKPRRKI